MRRFSNAYFTAERLLGRRFMMRLGRWIYCGARREFGSNMEVDGEFVLQRRVAEALAKAGQAPVILDVGANIGGWAAPMGKALEAAGVKDTRLVAFEPGKTQRRMFQEALSDSQGYATVDVQTCALGAEAGTAEFELTGETTSSSGLLTKSGPAYEGSRIIEVEIRTVDEILGALGIEHVDFMKIDTEGNDLNVLRGASKALSEGRIACVQFEYNARWIDFRFFLRDVYDLVRPMGYRIGKIAPDGIEIFDDWHPELERFIETNFVMMRPELAAPLGAKAFRIDDGNIPVPA